MCIYCPGQKLLDDVFTPSCVCAICEVVDICWVEISVTNFGSSLDRSCVVNVKALSPAYKGGIFILTTLARSLTLQIHEKPAIV